MKISQLITVIILAIPGVSLATTGVCPTPQTVLDTAGYNEYGSIVFEDIGQWEVLNGNFPSDGNAENLSVKFYNAQYQPRGLDKGVVNECVYVVSYSDNGKPHKPGILMYESNTFVANPTVEMGNWPSSDNIEKVCYGQNNVDACKFDMLFH